VGYAAGTAMLHVHAMGSRRPIAHSPFAMEIVPAATHIPSCSLSARDTGETMVAGGECVCLIMRRATLLRFRPVGHERKFVLRTRG